MSPLERIVDLHAHLFNARCIPLASIIANAMNRDHDPLASALAWLLELVTESSYEEPPLPAAVLSARRQQAYYIEQICNVVEFELRLASGAADAADARRMTVRELQRVRTSELMQALLELERARNGGARASFVDSAKGGAFGPINTWARRNVRESLRVTIARMDRSAWGPKEDYAEFFFNMLRAEEHMVRELKDGYGKRLPPMRMVHHMMDMQMAYAGHEEPWYPFWPTQTRRMQVIQRHNKGSILGFCAFDPRREDWRVHAESALKMGFMGFKFYPAMGYKPSGDKHQQIRDRVRAFFEFCVAQDVPVFTHCTPQGFQTRCKLGLYADPKLWRDLLSSNGMSRLRLCLGHAGGGSMSNVDPDTGRVVHSAGWMSTSQRDWDSPDNFAKTVAELCCTYENVYGELAYITELLEPPRRGFDPVRCLKDNLDRAISDTASLPYHLLDKLAYGSDWHMPSMVDNTRRYLDVFLKLRADGTLDDRFFWKNAYRYLAIA